MHHESPYMRPRPGESEGTTGYRMQVLVSLAVSVDYGKLAKVNVPVTHSKGDILHLAHSKGKQRSSQQRGEGATMSNHVATLT